MTDNNIETKKRTVIKLIGRKEIVQMEVLETYTNVKILTKRNKTKSVKKLVKTEELSRITYPLIQAEINTICDLIKGKIPLFVLKDNGAYYYALINHDTRFWSADLLSPHLCRDCKRLSPLPDELGGCKKIRDRYPSMENYNFMPLAYMTFNTRLNGFGVFKCNNFTPYENK